MIIELVVCRAIDGMSANLQTSQVPRLGGLAAYEFNTDGAYTY